jgi:hypothetical protein
MTKHNVSHFNHCLCDFSDRLLAPREFLGHQKESKVQGQYRRKKLPLAA